MDYISLEYFFQMDNSLFRSIWIISTMDIFFRWEENRKVYSGLLGYKP